ncbi:MAG: 30S ribosomal protein S8 [Patescibacteria group bacterium]|nr:30S ribosomal protein S8 [Patescibacteria group bacterium]
MITDPISDMLTRIRNAYAVGKDSVIMQPSKTKESILVILKKAGYVQGHKVDGRVLTVVLSYVDSKPSITKVERVSKPGRRIYLKKDEIPTVLSGQGLAIVSTSKGMMTGEEAKTQNLGGELIAKVY